MKRKKAHNISYSRILFIDSEIAKGDFPNAVSLSQKYEVSESTIKRDISYMRDVLAAPIRYNSSKKGHYYSSKIFKLPALFTNLEGINSAAIALKLLSQYDNIPIYNNIKSIFDSFNSAMFAASNIDEDKNDSGSWLQDRISFPPNVLSKMVDINIWDMLIDAMHKNKYVEFCYDFVSLKKYLPKMYRVAPYQMILKNTIWYLVGSSKEGKHITTYSIIRMRELKILDDIFEIPDKYQYLISNNNNLICKILFFNEACTYVCRHVWGVDQVVEEIDSSIIELTFSTEDIQEILVFIISQGKNAIPLQPIELVNLWKEEIKFMSENASLV